MKQLYLFLMFAFMSSSMIAQTYQVSGTVTDNGESLIGVSVIKKGTAQGTVTDLDGKYSLEVSNGDVLVFSYVGYAETSVTMDGQATLDVSMETGIGLDEIVVTGNRAKARTVLDSPVPIDNISADELKASGQTAVDQMLVYKVPSYNAANQAISDATAHFDPADLRGLGPSRTLVLVNGKRKNAASQIYLNGTPGKGEVGTDMKSIPAGAIKRIEVLRDGASAQYGSDAIAGVINIILKDDAEFSSMTTTTGITSKGDGFNFGIDYNSTLKVGKGTVNYTLEYYDQKHTNRAGEPGVKDLPGAPDASDLATYPDGVNDELYKADLLYHNNITDWATKNPTLGMIVGQPDLTKKSAMVNAKFPLGENSEFYTFHAVTQRDGRSFAYYRAPYWRHDVRDAEYLTRREDHIGYHPTFEANVLDNLHSAGVTFDLAGMNADASVTYGRNYVDYTVNRSVNRDYLRDHGWSPRTFHPGGYAFSNLLGNLDLSKSFNDMVSMSAGLEYKKDTYSGHQGDEVSFYKGGSDSFAGIKPFEATTNDRTSYAGYAALDFDINESVLLGAAARYEDFSDFGGNLSWKVNGRYKIGAKGAVRASVSTGFRAPSLHQRHIQLSQYIIVTGSPDPQLQGTLPNSNSAVQALGVPNLFAETSLNIAGGVTFKFSNKLSLTADVYSIKIKDRVLFSSQITAADGTLDGLVDGAAGTSEPIEQILIDNEVLALQFFINAVNTKTLGGDFVLNYQHIPLGKGTFGATLAANFNKTEIDGAVTTPDALKNAGYDIFNRREAGRITDARPKSKITLGLNYKVGKFNFALNNTRFGEVTVFHGSDENLDQLHGAKIATDLIIGLAVSDKVKINFSANNLLDVYPDVLHDGTDGNADLRSAGGRFLYSSEVTQLGFLGRTFKLGLNVNF